MNRRRFVKYVLSVWLVQSLPPFDFGNLFAPRALASMPEMEAVDRYRKGDVLLDSKAKRQYRSILNRLSRLQRTVGYAHFCLFDFDEMRRTARSYDAIGEFPRVEVNHLEKLFYTDARRYGFQGPKTLDAISDAVDKQRTVKIPASGNYLYKGESERLFRKLSNDVGDQLVLTAGIRGLAKQFYLFLSKALKHDGNLSLASRSIAPPGYSFHAAGDFDVGQAGFGVANFSRRFTQTGVYARLNTLDYVRFRYPPDNPTGVMFEPWHIQVV